MLSPSGQRPPAHNGVIIGSNPISTTRRGFRLGAPCSRKATASNGKPMAAGEDRHTACSSSGRTPDCLSEDRGSIPRQVASFYRRGATDSATSSEGGDPGSIPGGDAQAWRSGGAADYESVGRRFESCRLYQFEGQ